MNRLWKEGTIGIPVSGTKEVKIAHFWAKVYDEGSEYGIDEGRISKLTVKIDGVTVINYDRGWDIKPDEDDEVAQIALAILLNDYN
jgi:hypothetical protein